MGPTKKEDGYVLDDFVVGERANVINAEEEVEADGDDKIIKEVMAPRTPKKAPTGLGLINTAAMRKNSDTKNEPLYEYYDSEALDALLGAETGDSSSDDDYSDFAPEDESSADKSAAKKGNTKIENKTESASTAATTNKDSPSAADLIQNPAKLHAFPKAEESPPKKKKRDFEIYEDDDYDKAGIFTAKDKAKANMTAQKGDSPTYRQLLDMFELSSPPSNKRMRK